MSKEVHEYIQLIYNAQVTNRWRIAQTSAAERMARLRKLRQAILDRSTDLQQAIYDDFRKNPAETSLTEIYPVLAELHTAIRHLARWMRPRVVKTPLMLFGTRSEIRYEAKGVVLILSPWNYPFLLAIVPLISAVAAGNCVILRPSEKTRQTARFLKTLLAAVFPQEEVAVVAGEHAVADALLELPFDHIFFTGSPKIGRKVMTAAAKHLTPVTLELGGKSPAIIDQTADVRKAAERITWGKFINAGQSCVAPDYALVHESQIASFVDESKKLIRDRYGSHAASQTQNEDYCLLVNDGQRENLLQLIAESTQRGAKIEIGGVTDSAPRFIPPTLLSGVGENDPIMRDEIFGPVLPIVSYRSLDEALEVIRRREKPLALYIFSRSKAHIERILKSTTAGGTCINSLVIHLANPNLPFGGVGMSGMGNYHGFFGFKTFSHERAVLRQSAIDVLQTFYPPYTSRRKRWIEFVTRRLP